jgi:hypothetical protein
MWWRCSSTFASHCVMRNYNLREVQVWMGHCTITVTERYAHLAPGHANTNKLADLGLLVFYGPTTAPTELVTPTGTENRYVTGR